MPLRPIHVDTVELKRLVESFDSAWLELNREAPIHPEDHLGAQNRLGEIIAQLWIEDRDAPIVERALSLFKRQSDIDPSDIDPLPSK